MVKIKFIRQGSNSMLGGFSSGDFARVSEALAKHLVDEALVAVYAEPKQPPAEDPPADEPPAEEPPAEEPPAEEPPAEEPAVAEPATEQSAEPEKTTRSSRNKASAA